MDNKVQLIKVVIIAIAIIVSAMILGNEINDGLRYLGDAINAGFGLLR